MTRYAWVIVGVGIVATGIGQGAMISLSIFLQPMSEAMGWSRTGISAAALLSWISMGVGSLLWGALSDRFGTRAVVLSGGALLGLDSYFWLFIGSFGIGLGAVAIACTFRPLQALPAALPSPSVAS